MTDGSLEYAAGFHAFLDAQFIDGIMGDRGIYTGAAG